MYEAMLYWRMPAQIDSDWRQLTARERDYLRLVGQLDDPTVAKLERARSGTDPKGSEYPIVEGLETRGYLERDGVSGTDGRVKLLSLTDAGRDLLRRAGVAGDE